MSQCRDNLTSAVPMPVSAIFWFHPLVWWMTKQLVKERELACDEEVVNLYYKRQVYAESILKVCEFCIESPLPCASGITGADLKKRVVQIMRGRIVLKLSLGGKLLLLASVIVAASAAVGMVGVRPSVAQTVGSGKSEAKLPQSFEVVSIRSAPEDSQGAISEPQGMEFRAKAMPLSVLVQMAFGINPNQMAVPKWAQGVKFDIAAKTGGDAPLTYEEMKPLMQEMLAERFGMTYHRQTQDVKGYDMVAAKGGLKLTPAKPGAAKGGTGSRTSIEMPSATMQALAGMLTARLTLPVEDKTGAAGNYEVVLRFAREDDPESTLPSIFTALQEEMGIKLVLAKVPVKMVVIDHLERRPTEN
jgi:bla regulator protein blaR1